MTATLRRLAALCALLLAASPCLVSAQALSPAFTYQGELRLASGPASASFDMQFRLYNAQAGGSQIGATVSANNVAVSGGLFSVPLDFGPAQFAGERQWLEIAIRPAGAGSFETLSPRTELTAAPYAWSAAVALANSVTTTSIVDGTIGTADINPTQIQRRVGSSCAAGQYVRVINQDGSVTCDTDANAGGTVTNIATGAGLTGGPIVGSGSISVAAGGIGTTQINDTQVQRRVSGSCPAGQYVRVVNQDGTVTCGTDASGTPGWGLSGNVGTNPATNFIGTTDAQPFVVRVGNAPSLRIEPSTILFGGLPITTNTIAGSSANEVTAGVRGATIAGGGLPSGDSDPEFDAENPNRVTDHYGTVGGGFGNRAGDDADPLFSATFTTIGGGWSNTASGGGSTVSGGLFNTASDGGSTVGGGDSNTAAGVNSSVGGGQFNFATGPISTVGGGFNNTATNAFSTVGGGELNIAAGLNSSVGGGQFNTASGAFSAVGGGLTNIANGEESVVGGGAGNRASGDRTAVLGGGGNTASGRNSAVGGGFQNCAGGFHSWAGGTAAKVRPGTSSSAPGVGCAGIALSGSSGDSGTFVWADLEVANFVSTGPNQFLVRAAGGMAINTNTPAAGTALTVNGNVALSTTGSLSFGSQTRQMLNLFGTGFGIGVQGGRQYFRVNPSGGFAWYEGGSHASGADDPGPGGNLRMRLSNTGQLQTTTGTISTLSDARLKNHVADYTEALDQINALRPVSYRYADAGKAAFQPEGRHLGFIAQEVQQVFPQWVSAGEDGHLMLSLRGFEAVAVRAIQELSAENAALREGQADLAQENAVLRESQTGLAAENVLLRTRLAAIEARLGLGEPKAR